MVAEVMNGGDEPYLEPVKSITTPAVVGICLGTTFLVATLAAVTYFCYKRRSAYNHKLLGVNKHTVTHPPLVLKRPGAVKSPAGGSHYLRKSPSPTGGRSPPGSKSAKTSPETADKGGLGSKRGSLIPTSSNSPSPGSPQQLADIISFYEESEKDLARRSRISGKSDQHQQRQALTTTGGEATAENGDGSEKQQVLMQMRSQENKLDTSDDKGTKLGTIHFKIKYKSDKNALIVTVLRCTGLTAKDTSSGSSDPYVKLQLLPEKQHRVKTRVLRKTLNPVYDEDFTFYGISYNQLEVITLHFVVLCFDRYSRDDVIGEVFYSLDPTQLSQDENNQVSVSREIQPRNLKIRSQGRGEILVSLCWQPAANRLSVVILKARNLPKMDVTGLADPYVKIYLTYNGQRIAKKKTHVKKRTLNPVFNESFVFEIPAGDGGLDNVCLEFLLLDWDRVTKNEVIGHLELGGQKATETAVHHWNEVCNSPRRQIAEWHKLKD